MKILNFIQGYKTKIGIGLAVILVLAESFGIVPDATWTNTLESLSIALAGYGIYDKIGRK